MDKRHPEVRREDDLEALRKSLGSVASTYTEAQLRQFQRDIDSMAELLLDFYFWKKRERGREQRGGPEVIDSADESATLPGKGPPSEPL